MTNIYVHSDLSEMHLYPCAYSMTFNVTQKEKGNRNQPTDYGNKGKHCRRHHIAEKTCGKSNKLTKKV